MCIKLDLNALPVRKLIRFIMAVAIFGSLCAVQTNNLDAQRARFDDAFQINPGGIQVPQVNPQPVFGGQLIPGNGQILPGNAPIITTNPPPAIIQTPNILTGPNNGVPTPSFDPFQTPNNIFPAFPQANGGNFIPAPQPGNSQFFAPQPQPQTQPFFIPGQNLPNPNPQSGFGGGPSNQWPYQAPGTSWPNTNWAWPNQVWARLKNQVVPRLLERPRFRHTWLEGDEGNELDINDTEIATTMTFANWLGTSQPVRVTPGFIFHFWNGPDTAVTGFDLPGQAFSIYVGSDYTSDQRRQSGIETNLTVGFYSDFANTSTDGIRITGTGLGWVRVNSYTTFKFGVEYLDRIDVKLLPAVGVFLNPNPDLLLNIYFPRPKLAQRLPRFGPFEVWAYVGAEYGGGSWAIEREPLMGPNFDDQVDINDVRAFIGTEWMGPRRVTGFFEVGYAFDRELLYKSDQNNKLELQDTFMLRTGLAF